MAADPVTAIQPLAESPKDVASVGPAARSNLYDLFHAHG
jgi:hypothetical protein